MENEDDAFSTGKSTVNRILTDQKSIKLSIMSRLGQKIPQI